MMPVYLINSRGYFALGNVEKVKSLLKEDYILTFWDFLYLMTRHAPARLMLVSEGRDFQSCYILWNLIMGDMNLEIKFLPPEPWCMLYSIDLWISFSLFIRKWNNKYTSESQLDK